MTQTEYEQKKKECWKELWNDLIKDKDPVDFPTAGDIFEYVFPKAYALGKQEKDADTVIQGWVAIDEGADCPRFYNHKPFRKKDGFKDGLWSYGMEIGLKLDPTLFPDLTWESDPEPVEIIIKRKKK